MQPHPHRNLHWYPLTSSKNIWPKISVACSASQNDFNLFLLLVGGGCTVLSISPCWPLPTYPHRVVKRPHFEAWTRPDPKSQARTRLEPDIYFWSPIYAWKSNLPRGLRYAQLGSNKKRCLACRSSCKYMVYHIENSNHLDQNIGIIWHKCSMLVKDNTAECGI